MQNAPLCPHCHKRLPIRELRGSVIVYCRYCKREIAVDESAAA